MRRSSFARLLVVASVLAVSCTSGGTTDSTNGTSSLIASIVAGNAQSATVGQAVTTHPAVKVTNSAGVAQSGVAVTFSVTAGGGSVSGGSQSTGADGVATVGGWTLGTVAGSNTMSATVTGVSTPVSFTATAVAGAAATLAKVAGDALTSAAGVAVSTKPAAKATDTYGNAVSGVPVTFAVASGGGNVSGTSQTTGADGVATVGGWTLGNTVGANTMTATAAGLAGSPLTFSATAVAGPVASLLKLAGDLQSTQVGTALAIAPSVRAADQFGNLIANQAVNFAVASGGGSVTGGAQTSNASGIATVGSWTLGGVAGINNNTMIATASGVTATFTATATAAFNALQYQGTYNGTWTNTTFASTGTGTANVNVSGSTATVTVNVTGNVLGTGGVTNSVNPGTFTSNGATFTGNVAPMGNIVASINAAGAVTASGTGVPNASIQRWDASGTLTATALNLTFTVTFVSGPPAVGTITLTKP